MGELVLWVVVYLVCRSAHHHLTVVAIIWPVETIVCFGLSFSNKFSFRQAQAISFVVQHPLAVL